MKTKYKKVLFIITILISMTFIQERPKAETWTEYQNDYKGKILIMNPSINSAFDSSLVEGLNQYLDDNLRDYKVIVDSSSSRSYDTVKYTLEKLIESSGPFDLIISLDENTTKILSAIGDDLFKDIPIIFGISAENITLPNSNAYGYYSPYDFENLMNTLLTFHPKTKEVNFLINRDFKKTYFYKKILTYNESNNSGIKFNFIQTGIDTEIMNYFTKEDSLNISFSEIKSLIGVDEPKYLSEYESMKEIATVTDNPTYGGLLDFCTTFNIGGYNYSGFKLGTALGKLSHDILINKVNPSSIGITEFKENDLLIINQELMNTYNIPSNYKGVKYSTLTTGETFITRKNNMYILITFFIFLIIIIALIFNQVYTHKIVKEQAQVDFMKTNFIANVSHELRTPLNIIISTIQLIDMYIESGELQINNKSIYNKFDYLRNNSNRLLRLVNNIIDTTKLDAGYFTIEKTNNDIISVIEDITLSTVPFSEKKEIELIFDTDLEELYCSFDKDKIERVFLNLLSNAIKFTPPGGRIFVNISCNSREVITTVKDTGIGIPEDKYEYVFKRFRQANDTIYNKNEGSGIGLSICKSMVELHGGTISLDSKINEGTTFTVNLPIIKSDSTISDNSQHQSSKEKLKLEFSDFTNFI
ncbi:ATP-binding protein [Clostridium paraputrificum]|uniref:sensor histidine kinase n=1 Tax=Clostridium TaxID=1485 RepID=UPI003D34C819